MIGLTLTAKPKKLVIVEDVEGMLAVLADKFRREGFTVFTAVNGQDGYKCIKKHLPDLIIADVYMPILSGIEMMRKVRQDPEVRHIPVVFLSVMSEQEHEELIQSVGNVAGYLWKNEYGLDEIVHHIKKIMQK